MELIPQFKEALTNLLSAKMRSFLAILGILVGTASVVAMVSCGQLATEAALAQFKSLGTNLLSMSAYDSESEGGSSGGNKQFSIEDAMGIESISPEITMVAPYTSLYQPISYRGSLVNGSIIGANDRLAPAIKIEMAKGRFLSFLDVEDYFCVIGDGLYQQLKSISARDPIGKQIFLGSYVFTIVGVAKPWQENSFFREDVTNSVIIPLQTSQIISKYALIRNVVMRLSNKAKIDRVQKVLTEYMSMHASNKKLMFQSAKQLIASMQKQQKIYTILLGLIGSISLIVGGIGVMNIMLVSVIERKREIGIRMAIGACRRDIRILFLVESVGLSILGGFLGVILGVLTSLIIAHFAGWHFKLFLFPPFIGFMVSVATGVFFGYYPAFKASQLDPIAALRSD